MLVFFIVIIVGIILFLCSEVAIKIENLKIVDNKKIEGKIFFQLLMFNKSVLNIRTGDSTINKMFNKQKNKKNKLNGIESLIKDIINNLIKIKYIDLEIQLGTGDILITTYIITIISTILSCVLPLYIEGKLKDNYYKVQPIYKENFTYEISLNSIIAMKTVHIIHIIYLSLKKKRRDEGYDRASNRKSYEGSYE